MKNQIPPNLNTHLFQSEKPNEAKFTGKVETVEEYLARGGKIKRLPSQEFHPRYGQAMERHSQTIIGTTLVR